MRILQYKPKKVVNLLRMKNWNILGSMAIRHCSCFNGRTNVVEILKITYISECDVCHKERDEKQCHCIKI